MDKNECKGNENCHGSLDVASSIALAVLNSLSGLASVGGNLLVLLAIYKFPRLHTVSNFFIASLAAADFIVGLVLNPIWAIKSGLNIWENNAPLTIAAECLAIHTIAATTLSLCAVSIDRYLAVVAVLRYQVFSTVHRCKIVIFSIWLLALTVPLPRLAVQNPLDLPKLWITGSVLIFFVPLSVIAFCYFHIFNAARTQARKINTAHVANETDKQVAISRKKERKAALTIAIIIGLFIIFWSPTMILSSVQMFTSNDCLKIQLIKWWSWTTFVAFINSAVNPWVYAIRGGEFRNAFKRIFGRRNEDITVDINAQSTLAKTKPNRTLPTTDTGLDPGFYMSDLAQVK